MENKKINKDNSNKGLFLITRKGLEIVELEKSTTLCHVVKRENKNKLEYCYKTRFIQNPSLEEIKQYKIKK